MENVKLQKKREDNYDERMRCFSPKANVIKIERGLSAQIMKKIMQVEPPSYSVMKMYRMITDSPYILKKNNYYNRSSLRILKSILIKLPLKRSERIWKRQNGKLFIISKRGLNKKKYWLSIKSILNLNWQELSSKVRIALKTLKERLN